jgi:hypothetical protein
MSRSVIVKWFYASLIGLAGGLVALSVAGVVALGSDVLVLDGPDVVGIRSSASAWTFAGLLVLALLAILGSSVAAVVAWIGALLNTANLADKTWFIVLLVVGLLGLVFFALVAYVAAGPDGVRPILSTGVGPTDQRTGRDAPANGTNRQHVGV